MVLFSKEKNPGGTIKLNYEVNLMGLKSGGYWELNRESK